MALDVVRTYDLEMASTSGEITLTTQPEYPVSLGNRLIEVLAYKRSGQLTSLRFGQLEAKREDFEVRMEDPMTLDDESHARI